MIYFKSQVERLLAEKQQALDLLRAERDQMRRDLDLERARANTAIDRLLMQSGSGAVTPPPKREDDEKPKNTVLSQLAYVGEDLPDDGREAVGE